MTCKKLEGKVNPVVYASWSYDEIMQFDYRLCIQSHLLCFQSVKEIELFISILNSTLVITSQKNLL